VLHLDTSFLIRALVAATPEDRRLRAALQRGQPLAMSMPAWAEFLCGPVAAAQVDLARVLIGERVDLSERDAEIAAQLFNSSGRRRGSFLDCLIAACAIRTGSPLLTCNPGDFLRFEEAGLVLVPR